jgi:calcineurin-like phosphoesterase family protein
MSLLARICAAAALAAGAAPAAHATAPVMVAVGDIACRPGLPRAANRCHQAGTEGLAERLNPAVVAVLGDAQYDRGAPDEFAGSFARTWGRLKPRIRPAAGNHEYLTPLASGYFSYFGAAAGAPGRGYYSYDLGTWHVVVLNSNCFYVACRRGSAQERWLRADLAAHPSLCTLAYWHHPRFTSGYHNNFVGVAPFWSALYAAGADVVVTGHDHSYERFAPQSPTGRADPARGIREFIVGTGGEILRIFHRIKPNSQRRNNRTFGVLALTLRPGGYGWRFVSEPGAAFTDAGSGRCH